MVTRGLLIIWFAGAANEIGFSARCLTMSLSVIIPAGAFNWLTTMMLPILFSIMVLHACCIVSFSLIVLTGLAITRETGIESRLLILLLRYLGKHMLYQSYYWRSC